MAARFSPPLLNYKGFKLHGTFDAPSSQKFAGLGILPTNNLVDHLGLHNDTQRYVFLQTSFLKTERKSLVSIANDDDGSHIGEGVLLRL